VVAALAANINAVRKFVGAASAADINAVRKFVGAASAANRFLPSALEFTQAL